MIKKLKVFEVTQKKNKIKIYDTEELYYIKINYTEEEIKNGLILFVTSYFKKNYNLKIEGFTEKEKGFNLYTKNFEIKL
jgi:hypothetical protein